MESRNKGMGKVALGVLSSLSESYTLLPFMVFSSLISEKTGKVDFLVPVIVIYSIESLPHRPERPGGDQKSPKG